MMSGDYEHEEVTIANGDVFCHTQKVLSPEEELKMEKQNARLVSAHKANMLEVNAKKYWDLFYKRNETNFFRDRNWTTREFKELTARLDDSSGQRTLIEIGCGVGNMVYPLLKDGLTNCFIVACDISPRAIDFVKSNELYDETKIKALQADITSHEIFDHLGPGVADVATMIFVLSAIHPDKFGICVENVFSLLKPGGVVLFRDYGLYDMAQLRFKAGHKIANNFYMRQDGTRSYFFSEEQLSSLFTSKGFKVVTNSYIHRRTINLKEKIDVPRIFIQAKFMKPDV